MLHAWGVDRAVAVLTSVLTAAHPYQIWLAQDVRNMYQLAVLFSLLALAQVPALQTTQHPWRTVGYFWLAATLAIYHYYTLFAWLALGLLALVWITQAQRRTAAIKLLIGLCAVALVYCVDDANCSDLALEATGRPQPTNLTRFCAIPSPISVLAIKHSHLT